MEKSKDVPKWVDYILRTRQSYLTSTDLNDTLLSRIDLIFQRLAPNDNNLTGLFPVAHEDQTAFIVIKERAAIFFDVGQAAIIKSAFAYLSTPDYQQKIFQLFLSAASLKISPGDQFLADKIGDAASTPYDGSRFIDEATLRDSRGTLHRYTNEEIQSLFDTVVDNSIIAHELYHYRTKTSQQISKIDQQVADHYESFVEAATTISGPLRIPEESETQRSKRQRELISMRQYYLDQRDMISEEMACDFYAFTCLTNYLLKDITEQSEANAIIELLVALNSIAFNFHLLHLAFTQRAQTFADGNHKKDLPNFSSLYNLRRIAIGVLSSEWAAHLIDHFNQANGKHQSEISKHFQLLQNRLYIEMSPTLIASIPMLHDIFSLVDSTFPRDSRRPPQPTENNFDRLFLSSLLPRLNPGVLSSTLTTSARILFKKEFYHKLTGMSRSQL